MSEKHRTALIGYGRWGKKIAGALTNSDRYDLRYIVTRTGAVDEPLDRVTHLDSRGIAEIAGDPDIDSVFIATPPATHFPLARYFLEAGKHVFVEKPFSTSLRDASHLLELAGEVKRTLHAGHVYAYTSPFRQMLGKLEDDKVLHASIHWSKYGTFDFDIANNLLVHEIFSCINLFGESPTGLLLLDSATQAGTSRVDLVEIGLHFSDNRNALIRIDRMSDDPGRYSHWYTASGKAYRLTNDQLVGPGDAEATLPEDGAKDALSRMVEHFDERIRHNEYVTENEIIASRAIQTIEELLRDYPFLLAGYDRTGSA
jgi:predicted dehydrogenase